MPKKLLHREEAVNDTHANSFSVFSIVRTNIIAVSATVKILDTHIKVAVSPQYFPRM